MSAAPKASPTPVTVPVEENADGDAENVDEVPEGCWGKLLPMNRFFRKVYLTDGSMKFGRNEDSDYVLAPPNDTSPVRNKDGIAPIMYSQKHFQIIREEDKSGGVVWIKDESTNGTFLNKEKIGKGLQKVLKSGDEIALVKPTFAAFVFLDNQVTSPGIPLPAEFESRYVLSKQIGEGACGKVYLCFSKDYTTKYAVKVIQKKELNGGQPKWNEAEIKILRSVDHPNIIKVNDFFETDTHGLIVLEYADGGELFDWVVSTFANLKPHERMKKAKWIFAQIATALEYLHRTGITHRDLKTENVLIFDEEEDIIVKLSDFGFSKVFDGSILKTVCGTPIYMAPEIVGGQSTPYTEACDCWSLGCILFILLSCSAPFSDNRETPLNAQILSGAAHYDPKRWEHVDPQARDLVEKLLVVEPAERYTVKQVLEHRWLAEDLSLAAKLHKWLQSKVLDPESSIYTSPLKRLLGVESPDDESAVTRPAPPKKSRWEI